MKDGCSEEHVSPLNKRYQIQSLPYEIRRGQLSRFYLIKYVHIGPCNELAYFGIAGLIFLIKAIRFGTIVGLNMLLNTRARFYYDPIFCEFVCVFHIRALKITVRAVASAICLGYFKHGKDNYCSNISGYFNYGSYRSKYAHNWQFNELINFGIPWIIVFKLK